MARAVFLRVDRHGVAYWQEFVAKNRGDLRITVIGDRDAFGFWRRNRPGDFRASGSGLLDYDTPVPEEAVRLCLRLSRQFGFDSMAYDILFREGQPLVIEMSYGYIDSAVFNAPGHFRLDDQDELTYLEGHVMPQTLWVDWALRKVGAAGPAG
jgi:glutathione synthase/RimK-type ligase-like ATP-grasp enzyme